MTANLIPQLVGGAASLASAIPTSQDKLMGRLAKGQEDPAVAALRRRLAQQNAATAQQIAASQQGVNPALANRSAQMGLAQSQIATNAELARSQMSSTQQARQSDPLGRRRDLGLQGAGQLLNVLGTGLSAQQAATPPETPDQLGAPRPAPASVAQPMAAAAQQPMVESPSMPGSPGAQPGVPNGTLPSAAPRAPDLFDPPGPQAPQAPQSAMSFASPPRDLGGLGALAPSSPGAMAAPALAGEAAPRGAAPPPPPSTAPHVAVGDVAIQQGPVSVAQQYGIDPDAANDPMNAGIMQRMEEAHAAGNRRMAELYAQMLLAGRLPTIQNL
jgi:hypothetical protein